MRRFSAALFLCLAAVVCSACGDSPARPKSSYVDEVPAPEEPLVMRDGEVGTYGGRFVVGRITSPQTFNSIVATSSYAAEITSEMFANLTRFDPVTQQVTPMLATSWDVAPDAKKVTFHLRRGARFSDGHPITADDVIFSARAAADPRVASSGRDLVVPNGKPLRFTAPDPHTLVVESDDPDSDLLTNASFIDVLPKHVLEPALQAGTFNSVYGVSTPPDQLVTSGPWKLKQYLSNERTVLTRNPFWFGVDAQGHRLPYLNELVFVIAPDAEASELKFRAGEVDAIPEPQLGSYSSFEEEQKAGGFQFTELGITLNPSFLFFNLNMGDNGQPAVGAVKYRWFSNVAFRRAVSKAINRDGMIEGPVFFGQAVKNWAFATPGDKVWGLPDVARDDYDPAGAKELLSSVGLRDRDGDGTLEDTTAHPVSFVLKVNGAQAAPNFIRDDLAKVGIKVTLSFVDFNTLTTNVNADFDYDATMLGRTVSRPGPSAIRNFFHTSGRTVWHVRQKEPDSPAQARVDQLVDTIVQTTEKTQQLASWRQLQTLANEQAWVIWMPVRKLKAPIRAKFGNLKPAVAGGGAYNLLWNAEQIFVKPQGRATN